MARLQQVWGTSPLNHQLDRAGRHRRLAAALPLLAVVLAVLAMDRAGGGDEPARWLAPLLLAGGSSWTAADLLRTGRMVNGARPHSSLVVTAAGMVGWLVVELALADPPAVELDRSGALGLRCCGAMFAAGGGLILLAVSLFVAAERRSPRAAVPLGRMVLALGAAVVGVAAIGSVVTGAGGRQVLTAAMAALAAISLGLAVFEGGLALRMVRRWLKSSDRTR